MLSHTQRSLQGWPSLCPFHAWHLCARCAWPCILTGLPGLSTMRTVQVMYRKVGGLLPNNAIGDSHPVC